MNNGLVSLIAKCHESEETRPVELEGNRENTVAELSDNAIPSPPPFCIVSLCSVFGSNPSW
jgi:hypothetical protein